MIIVMVVVVMTLIIPVGVPWSDDHDDGGFRFRGNSKRQGLAGQGPREDNVS
jgi:hypothetical protein